MTQERYESESHPGKYWTMMLNMADDDLGPYEYRLLAYYVRWSSKGPKTEGIRTTADKCQMSPQRVTEARDELVRTGYIRYIPPTKVDKARGIGGTVIVIDRMDENVARYHRVKEIAREENGRVQNSIHDRVQNSVQSEEPSTEEQTTSASNDDAEKSTDKPLPATPKPKGAKAPDPWYDNILAVWGLHAGGNGDMRKFLEGRAVKKGWKEYNPPPGYTLIDAGEICSFARWYRSTKQGGKQGLSMVAERGKLQSAIMEWVDAGRPSGQPQAFTSERVFE